MTPTRKKPYVKPSLEKRERLTEIIEGGALGGTPGGVGGEEAYANY